MIDGDTYLDRIGGINSQFDFALRAIDGFANSPGAVDKYLGDEVESLRRMLKDVPKSAKFDPSQHWAFSEGASSKYGDWLKGKLSTRLEKIQNRLRQNKLILLVTILETILKDIHREVLRAKPNLLNPERKVHLGELIAIEREVRTLDYRSLEKRAEYFKERLNLNWFDGKRTLVPLAKPVFKLRNTILHEDPDAGVSKDDLDQAQFVCLVLPLSLIVQAEALYPQSFKW